jgi:hypothetical protein
MASMLLCIAIKSCTMPVMTPMALETGSMAVDCHGKVIASRDVVLKQSRSQQIHRSQKERNEEERHHVASRCGSDCIMQGKGGMPRTNKTWSLVSHLSMGKRAQSRLGKTSGSPRTLVESHIQSTACPRAMATRTHYSLSFIVPITSRRMSIGVPGWSKEAVAC